MITVRDFMTIFDECWLQIGHWDYNTDTFVIDFNEWEPDYIPDHLQERKVESATVTSNPPYPTIRLLTF